MANTRNYGVYTGRLTRNPVIFKNSDGSRAVTVNLAVTNNYSNKDGKKDTQFLQFKGFIRADKPNNGVYDCMHEGDLISIGASLRSEKWKDKKTQEDQYNQVAFIEDVDLLESKTVTENRKQNKAKANADATATAADNAAPVEAMPGYAPFE